MCQRSYHLHCAVVAGAQLSMQDFTMRCPAHVTTPRKAAARKRLRP
jgi:hypothetical protein